MKRFQKDPLHWRHRPFPELVRLAWPIGVSMLSYSVMTLVDTLFVGRLGASALAGVGVGGVFCFTLLCYGYGLLRGVKLLVSQAMGAGQRDGVVHIVGAGLMLGALFGVIGIVIGRPLAAELGRVSATAAAAVDAEGYAQARLWGAPAWLCAVALREAMYGRSRARLPMVSALVANVANIGLDALFIFHLDLGVAGAGWASVASQLVDLGVLALGQRRDGFGLTRKALRAIPDLWKVGVPLGAQMFLEVGSFAVLTAMFARMGEHDVAAHHIALQADHFSFLPALAIGEAASIMVGQAVGANEDGLVRGVARRTMAVAALYTGLCALVFVVFGHALAGAFTSDAALQAKAQDLFVVAAVFCVFDGGLVVARCVLRGTGDVRVPAWIAVSLAWFAGPPVAYWLGFKLGWGVAGGWIGLCGEIILGAVILWWRLEAGHWKKAAAASRERLERAREAAGLDGEAAPAAAE